MQPQAYSVLSGGTVAVTATTADSTGVLHTDAGKYVRITTDADLYFAVGLPNDADLTATTGAPLTAGTIEFIYVPRNHEIKLFGGSAAAVFSYNEIAKAP